MGAFKDITGQRFGRLVVVKLSHFHKGGAAYWQCVCDCGTEKIVHGSKLRNGEIKSCGCLKREFLTGMATTHGHTVGRRTNEKRSPEYVSWCAMLQRCYNSKTKYFKYYGAIGVTVFERWRNSFEAFFIDTGPRPPATTLDRWPDPYGNYEPGNVRWATPSQQQHNRRDNAYAASVRAISKKA